MMPCLMPALRSLLDVCLTISRVCASTSTRSPLATAALMIAAPITVFPAPVGATTTNVAVLLLSSLDHLGLIGPQLRSGVFGWWFGGRCVGRYK